MCNILTSHSKKKSKDCKKKVQIARCDLSVAIVHMQYLQYAKSANCLYAISTSINLLTF